METLLPTKTEALISSLLSGEDNLSYSSLSAFKKSPLKFIAYKLGVKEETDAMKMGRLVHCLILEPGEFEGRYFVIDDEAICGSIGGAKPRATNAYKEWKAQQVLLAGEKEIVSSDDYTTARLTAGNVLSNDAAAMLLKQLTHTEQRIEWEYKNFRFVGYLDGIGNGRGGEIIIDLKGCVDAEPKAFQRDLIKRGLYLQAAMYLIGSKKKVPYYIIAYDGNGGVSCHLLSDTLIEYGLSEYERLLDKFNECILNDDFGKNYDFYAERWDGVFYADKPGYLY